MLFQKGRSITDAKAGASASQYCVTNMGNSMISDTENKCTSSNERAPDEDLARARDMAEEANHAKSVYLANMSHELRTPLNAILGFTELLLRDLDVSQQHREKLRIIEKSGRHLLELLNEVLDLSKIEAGYMTLNKDDFDLMLMLETVESMFRAKADLKGLSLLMSLDPALPRCVRTDERKLRQALINLLDNAIKFTSEGGVTLRVFPVARPPFGDQSPREGNAFGTTIGFEVRDTGSGIRAQDMDGIFAPFTQAGPGTVIREGTGLGLTLSRSFARMMGGDITAKCLPGQGAMFEMCIITEAAATESPVSAQHDPHIVKGLEPGQPMPENGPFRILIADDNDMIRLLLREIHTRIGIEVHEANTGLEAVLEWKSWRPHLVWMDLRMPVMDGTTAMKQIKSFPDAANTPIIALTGTAFEEDREAALADGFDDYVRKPFLEADIYRAIEKHLGLRFTYYSAFESDMARPPRVNETSPPPMCGSLPENWKVQARQAASEGDGLRIEQLASSISDNHPDIAEHLVRLAQTFRFADIAAMVAIPESSIVVKALVPSLTGEAP